MKNKRLIIGTLIVSQIAFNAFSSTKEKSITYKIHTQPNAPTYVCYKAPSKIVIDGKLSKNEWDAIPWTSDFVDIEGDKQPLPTFKTRAKMTYDNDGMYFAVLMEEPHVWGTIKEHDAVIYQDNDFEIFLNPSNDTHNYLEYEINSLGTDWDLYLNKPYRDEGNVVLNNWEFAGMKKAVSIDGTLNNPKDKDKSWSVEVYIPWKSIYQVMRGKEKPQAGEQLRINFSRVEWPVKIQNGKYVKIPKPGHTKISEYNWVWAPTGIINIHLPEYWGYVQLSDKVAGKEEELFIPNPDEEYKWILRQLYYRQQEYKGINGEYATKTAILKPEEICSAEIAKRIKLYTTPGMYEITLATPNKCWHIRQDGLVW